PGSPANIETGKIDHGKMPHRHTEFGENAVDLLRRRTAIEQFAGLLATNFQHAVSDKAEADANHQLYLFDLLGNSDCCGQRIGRGLATTHDFAEPHDVCRAEEMHPEHVLGPLCCACDCVDVEIRRIGRQHRDRLGKAVAHLEDVELDSHGFESGFEHQVRGGDLLDSDRPLDQADPALDFTWG